MKPPFLLALTLLLRACSTADATNNGTPPPTSTSAHGLPKAIYSDTPITCGARQDKNSIVGTAIDITASVLAIAASCTQIVNTALGFARRRADRGSKFSRALGLLSELIITRHSDMIDTEYIHTPWHWVVKWGPLRCL